MVSVLNDAARTLEDLRAELPSVVDEAAAPLRKRRDATRDAQNSLWGQAKAPQVATRGRHLVDERSAGRPVGNRPHPTRAPGLFWFISGSGAPSLCCEERPSLPTLP